MENYWKIFEEWMNTTPPLESYFILAFVNMFIIIFIIGSLYYYKEIDLKDKETKDGALLLICAFGFLSWFAFIIGLPCVFAFLFVNYMLLPFLRKILSFIEREIDKSEYDNKFKDL